MALSIALSYKFSTQISQNIFTVSNRLSAYSSDVVIITSRGTIFHMKAPSQLKIDAANLYRKSKSVRSLEELVQLREAYCLWRQKAPWLPKNSEEAVLLRFTSAQENLLLKGDLVIEDSVANGGVGTDFEAPRAQEVLTFIQESLCAWIDVGVDIISTAHYEDALRTLYFAGESILVTDRSQSREQELLRVLFTEPSRVWATDEILEKWGENKKMSPYHAAKSLNKKVAAVTGITDFLIPTTKQIKINPSYI